MAKKPLKHQLHRDVVSVIEEFRKEDNAAVIWEGMPYGDIKRIENAKRGLLGERLVAKWLDDLDYLSEERGYTRQGREGDANCDIITLIDGGIEKLEVKFASLDGGGKYQFNWIVPKPGDIAAIIFFGLDPDSFYVSGFTTTEILRMIERPERGKTLTPVPKAVDDTPPKYYKWTASKEAANMAGIRLLADFKRFFDELAERIVAQRNAASQASQGG